MEANQSIGSWVMIGHTNKHQNTQKNRYYYFVSTEYSPGAVLIFVRKSTWSTENSIFYFIVFDLSCLLGHPVPLCIPSILLCILSLCSYLDRRGFVFNLNQRINNHNNQLLFYAAFKFFFENLYFFVILNIYLLNLFPLKTLHKYRAKFKGTVEFFSNNPFLTSQCPIHNGALETFVRSIMC